MSRSIATLRITETDGRYALDEEGEADGLALKYAKALVLFAQRADEELRSKRPEGPWDIAGIKLADVTNNAENKE